MQEFRVLTEEYREEIKNKIPMIIETVCNELGICLDDLSVDFFKKGIIQGKLEKRFYVGIHHTKLDSRKALDEKINELLTRYKKSRDILERYQEDILEKNGDFPPETDLEKRRWEKIDQDYRESKETYTRILEISADLENRVQDYFFEELKKHLHKHKLKSMNFDNED